MCIRDRRDIAIFVVMYVPIGLGVTVGFHRLFTHRSFKTSSWMRGLLAILGSMAIEGPVISWVADHRKHHAYSDRFGDPHSPHIDSGGGWQDVYKRQSSTCSWVRRSPPFPPAGPGAAWSKQTVNALWLAWRGRTRQARGSTTARLVRRCSRCKPGATKPCCH